MTKLPVRVVPHDPSWSSHFEAIKAVILPALQDVPGISSIEHVGSTSVPDLVAKPKIDMDVIVAEQHVPTVRRALVDKLECIDKGDLGIPGRYLLRVSNNPTLMAHNLYVCVENGVAVRNHLALRDTLRKDAALRKEYGDTKLELAARNLDVDTYCELKSEVIQKILRKAGMNDNELKQILDTNKADAEELGIKI